MMDRPRDEITPSTRTAVDQVLSPHLAGLTNIRGWRPAMAALEHGPFRSPDRHAETALAKEALDLERLIVRNATDHDHRVADRIQLTGIIPIVVSSPHAVDHPRWGTLKRADTFTGPLTLQLAALTRATALVYANTTDEDPNYDAGGPYKQHLATLVRSSGARLVVDIHGMARSRPWPIVIGTNSGKTVGDQHWLTSTLFDSLTRAGFENMLVDDPRRFNASHPHNVASFVWRELRTPAIQIEIHKDYRDPGHLPDKYARVLLALADALWKIQSALESARR